MSIEGRVRGSDTGALEAVVSLIIRGFSHQELTVPFVIDTGFTGDLSLTSEQVAFLDLMPGPLAETVLADGTLIEVPTYTAVVMWEHGVQNSQCRRSGCCAFGGHGIVDGA